MLRNQTSAKPEDLDKKLMKKISGWVDARTPQYLKFTEDGKSDFEYLGHMFKKAGIDMITGLDYAKKLGWIDITRNDELEDEFRRAYNVAEFDQQWRDKVIAKYL